MENKFNIYRERSIVNEDGSASIIAEKICELTEFEIRAAAEIVEGLSNNRVRALALERKRLMELSGDDKIIILPETIVYEADNYQNTNEDVEIIGVTSVEDIPVPDNIEE